MPAILPYVPQTITVHMGAPDQWAEKCDGKLPGVCEKRGLQ